ncbi:hypothetical protein BVX95_00370 [archaeon D22]|nr:hypothetical protein BVX95_00370 [archaeon D22]
MARPGAARLLVSDPFSWSDEIAPENAWLGGTKTGPFAGRARDNLRNLLETGFAPTWLVEEQGEVWWKIRNHANHFELIRSEYLLAIR